MLHRQNLADYLKAYVEAAPRPDQRRAGMQLLKQFEHHDTPWDADAFASALADYPAVHVTETALTIEGSKFQTARAATGLLRRYLEMIGADQPTPAEDAILTTDEATAYASQQIKERGKSLEPRGVLKYIRNPDFSLLRGTLKAHTLLFTRAEVDEFVDWYMNTDVKRGVKAGANWSPARRAAEEQ